MMSPAGRFAFARGFFEALAHQRNEFRLARGLHGQLAIVALTDQRLGECLLPLRRKCDQRQIAALTRVLRAELTRQVLSPADREGT